MKASYSFKYFGKDKGVSIYTFIDERQALFHSLVMSSAEREAAYVIDGLNNNDVTKVNIHSTNTHGYTELIFAATHFLDISFAPRLKNIGQQCIYAFSPRKTYEKLGYKILPSRTVNQKLNVLTNPEGKQDCELVAFERLAAKLKTYFPRLKIIVFADRGDHF